MKRLILSALLTGGSLFGDITPNFPAMTPEWATNDDIEVARTIAGEARGESPLGQSFVADVIHTRMMNKNKSAYEIVTEPNQFHGYYDGGEITDHVWKLVLKLKLGLDIIKDANFTQFRAYKLSPIPEWAKEPVVVGNHIFFTE
jgi:hypothetical protein